MEGIHYSIFEQFLWLDSPYWFHFLFMSDGMPAVLEPPSVTLPWNLAKRSKSIMKEHQAAQRENLDLVTVFNEGQNKRGDVGKKTHILQSQTFLFGTPEWAKYFPVDPRLSRTTAGNLVYNFYWRCARKTQPCSIENSSVKHKFTWAPLGLITYFIKYTCMMKIRNISLVHN